jgi:hypothetical protein
MSARDAVNGCRVAEAWCLAGVSGSVPDAEPASLEAQLNSPEPAV